MAAEVATARRSEHGRLEFRLPPAVTPQDRPTDTFALSSKMHTVTPDDLQRVGAKATDKPSMLIDDFAHGFQDWYRLSADNPHHWEFSTRKLGDPKWRGKPGYRLTLDVKTNKPNDLIVVITDNFFRSHRGKQKEFVAVVKLTVGDQTVSLSPQEFRQTDGEDTLTSWQNADILSLRAYVEKGEKLIGSKSWAGSQPEFRNLRWTTE